MKYSLMLLLLTFVSFIYPKNDNNLKLNEECSNYHYLILGIKNDTIRIFVNRGIMHNSYLVLGEEGIVEDNNFSSSLKEITNKLLEKHNDYKKAILVQEITQVQRLKNYFNEDYFSEYEAYLFTIDEKYFKKIAELSRANFKNKDKDVEWYLYKKDKGRKIFKIQKGKNVEFNIKSCLNRELKSIICLHLDKRMICDENYPKK